MMNLASPALRCPPAIHRVGARCRQAETTPQRCPGCVKRNRGSLLFVALALAVDEQQAGARGRVCGSTRGVPFEQAVCGRDCGHWTHQARTTGRGGRVLTLTAASRHCHADGT